MVLWEVFAIAGLGFIILEMLVPSMFFLNLAAAGFVTALVSLFIGSWITLTTIFVVLSILSIVFLRPLLVRSKESKDKETGIQAKYIGKEVKVTETVTKTKGTISIYDERWDARTLDDEEIPAGSMAKIVKNESLVMYVEKA